MTTAITKISGKQFTNPHGTFYSSATQAIADTGLVQVVALEKDSDVHGLTHSTVTNNSRVYVPYDGSYLIIFSGIADLSAGANKHIEIFLDIEGSAVADSNTRVELPTAGIEMTVAVAFIADLNTGEYWQLKTWGDSTSVRWLATAAGTSPDRPATPSVIVTCNMVNAY